MMGHPVMGSRRGKDVRTAPRIHRQSEALEAVCHALTHECPRLRVAYVAACLATFPALADTDPGDDATRARAAALPLASTWLAAYAPVLAHVPSFVVQLWALIVTPWLVHGKGDAPRLLLPREQPAMPPQITYRPGESAPEYHGRVNVMTDWHAATGRYPHRADHMLAGSWHLTPTEAWGRPPERSSLMNHARWWTLSQVEGLTFRAITAREPSSSPDLIGRSVRGFAETYKLPYTRVKTTRKATRTES